MGVPGPSGTTPGSVPKGMGRLIDLSGYVSHYSESKTPTARTKPKRRHENRRSQSPTPVASVFKSLKQNRPPSPRPRPRKEGGETSGYSESEDSEGGHWKSKSRRYRSNTHEDDHSQPWTCEERNPFTPRIRYFNFPRTRIPSHVKTYDGSGDPKDHLKLFQAAEKTERWAMPTWCHMFNSTLIGNARVWFDKLLRESIDSFEDERTAHLGKLSPTKQKHQGSGGDTSYQAKRWRIHGGLYGKIQSRNPRCGRSSECMKIFGFMHGHSTDECMQLRETDRRDDQVRQIVAIHQRIKAERQAKGIKEGGNGRKR
ncbi:hypothetical protein Tco_1314282 [Tanacetum coccineum]